VVLAGNGACANRSFSLGCRLGELVAHISQLSCHKAVKRSSGAERKSPRRRASSGESLVPLTRGPRLPEVVYNGLRHALRQMRDHKPLHHVVIGRYHRPVVRGVGGIMSLSAVSRHNPLLSRNNSETQPN
jgi:hypothetical protein